MFTLQPTNVADRSQLIPVGGRGLAPPPKQGMFHSGHRAYNPDFQPWDMDFATYRPSLNPQDFQSATFDVNKFLDVPFDAALGGRLPTASYQKFTEEESMRRPFLAAENRPAQSGRELSSFDNQNVLFLHQMQQLKNNPYLVGKSTWEVHEFYRKGGMKQMYDDHFNRSANGMGYSIK